jgi:hypothetical protein
MTSQLDCHLSVEECQPEVHAECTGCEHEKLHISKEPCKWCWNGGGPGDWCYFKPQEATDGQSTTGDS